MKEVCNFEKAYKILDQVCKKNLAVIQRFEYAVGKLEIIFAIVLTLIYEIGACLYFVRPFMLRRITIDVFLFVIITFTLSFLNRAVKYLREVRLKGSLQKNFFKLHSVIFLCLILVVIYLMCYISYYPGVAAYDLPSSLDQIKHNRYNNHQPLLYTFLIKFILWIAGGNYTNMLIIYSIFQMLFVIFVSFYSLFWLYKNDVNRFVICIGYFYFLFMPILHIFSIITTKDVLFSCFFLLFTINFIDLQKHFCKKNLFLFLLNGLLSCFMRNNMLYALVLFCIALLLKKNSRKIIYCNLTLILCFYLIQLFFYNICGLGKSPIQETICVPINQIAYVYVNQSDNLSNEEKEKITFYIPSAKNYNPRFIDPVKNDFNQDRYNNSKNEFWKLYLSLLKRYPFDYVKAFLNINLPYWFIGAKFPDPYSQRVYIETFHWWDGKDYPILERQNYLKPLNEFYESFATFNNKIMITFPFSVIFSLSFPFLSLVFSLYIGIKQKIYDLVWICVLYLLLIFTYILGPVSNFRYIYTFYLCLPLYLGIIFRSTRKVK